MKLFSLCSSIAKACVIAIFSVCFFTQAQAQAPSRPNILYIVADDLGWADVGFHGSDIQTPTLDALAKDGARLGQFYAMPMCTPTRAALLTGRYPLRYGLQTGVIPSGGTYGLSTDEYLLPQLLKDNGYTTALIGKWHLGHANKNFWPRQRGFDFFYGALVGEIDHFKHESHGVSDWYRDNEPIEEAGYDNDLFGQEAVKLIDAHDPSVPLFLEMAFTAPHTPFQAPQELLDRYSKIEDPQRRAYAAMVTGMDASIGNIIDALKRRGMLANTLVIFHSDNGGVRSAAFAGESKVEGALPASNGEFRDGKGTLYEGGTRVAALANWPGHIKPGEANGLIHVVDMYPTIAALIGAKLEKNKPLDGMDAWKAISEGGPSARKDMVYNVDPMSGAVRQGEMKLVWKATLPPSLELFDLGKDQSESTNIAASNGAVVQELQASIGKLAEKMAPPLLLMEAIRLTFGTPPVFPDPATAFNAGD